MSIVCRYVCIYLCIVYIPSLFYYVLMLYVMIQANRTLAAVDTIRAVTEHLINCSRYLNQSLNEFGPRLREVKKL